MNQANQTMQPLNDVTAHPQIPQAQRLLTLLFMLAMVAALTLAAALSDGRGAQTLQTLQGIQEMRVSDRSAQIALTYRRGYSVQGAWLCYGWATYFHCTQRWQRSGAYIISLNTAWVPNVGGGMLVGATSSASSTSSSGPAPAPLANTAYSAIPANLAQWAYAGRGAYWEPWGNTQGYVWGQCTSGAAQLAHDNVSGLGNAKDWLWRARARGLPTGYSPRVGATVVFQPGVQGASWLGHVAHVAAVYNNGWFMVQETNFWWNGGGFGKVSFRYAHVGSGVGFIY